MSLAEGPPGRVVRRQQGTVQTFQQPSADRQCMLRSTHRVLPHVLGLNVFPSSMRHRAWLRHGIKARTLCGLSPVESIRKPGGRVVTIDLNWRERITPGKGLRRLLDKHLREGYSGLSALSSPLLQRSVCSCSHASSRIVEKYG